MNDNLEQLDDNTLFEIYAESAIRLNARLVALRRKARAAGDTEAEHRFLDEARALHQERHSIDPDDVEGQRVLIRKWDARRTELLES